MKRFTSFLLAALIGVFAYAQKPLLMAPKDLVRANKPISTSIVKLPKTAPGAVKKTVRQAPGVIADGGTSETFYTTSGTFYAGTSSGWQDATSEMSSIEVTFDGNNVTITGLAYWFEDGTILGTMDGNTITFANGQLVGEDEYGPEYLVGSNDGSNVCDIVFTYDPEAGTLTSNTALIIESGAADAISAYCYWSSPVFSKEEPAAPELVTLPEGAEPVEYSLTYENEDGEAGNGAAAIAVVGNEVYVQGFSFYFPDAWVKGTKSGNLVTFEANQYVGTYGSYGNSYAFYTGDATFTFDPGTESYSAEGEIYGVLGGSYYDGHYFNPVLKKVIEKAVMPAAPSISEIYASQYGDEIVFDVPTIDVNGDGLLTSKLYYQFFYDVARQVSPLTFVAGEDYPYLAEDISEIPYGFKDADGQGYDFYDGEIFLNMDHSTWNKIGIKSIYYGGGEKNETEIQWYTISEYPEIVARQNLEAEIATAESLVDEEEKFVGLITYQQAIEEAKAVLDNEEATLEELNEAIEALKAAEEAYNKANQSGEEEYTGNAQWVASEQGYTNASLVTDITIVDGYITGVFDQGEGSNAPAYYTSGSALRAYSNNTLTITASDEVEKITKIEITFASTNYTGSYASAPEGYSISGAVGTWEGEATSVTLTNTATGQSRIRSINVTYVLKHEDDAPIAEGIYYIYNKLTDKFLSRGDAWGTRAVVDDYGFPINVTLADGRYTLTNVDGSGPYGDDYWMYADAGGDRTRTYAAERTQGGFYLRGALAEPNNRVYVYTKDDADKYAVAGNATPDENITDDAQTVWQFLTQAERDLIVAAHEKAAKEAALEATDFDENGDVYEGTPAELTFKTGSAWQFAAVRSGSSATTNENGTEVYQGTGNFTQTVEGLKQGLYKVSIQAFYRNGFNEAVAANYDLGYNLSVAYLEANGSTAPVKSWGADRASDTNPNSMTEAAALFAEGKYKSETYAVVGEDGVLNLRVAVPSFINGGWFIIDNVTYKQVSNEEIEEEQPMNIIDLIEITPAEGEVTSLQNFQITFGGEVVTVNEDLFPTLDGQDGGIAVSEDGKTVSIDFEEAVTEAGNYVLEIPAGAILYKGKALDPLSFKYNIKGADYTINPAEGEVEKLETFVITFNNYTVRATDEASAILINTETEAEVEASVVTEIDGGRAIYISLPEITAAGTYELIVMSGSIQKDIDDSFVPELTFHYTIKAGDGINLAGNQTETIRTFDVAGRVAKADTKGLVIQQVRQADGTLKTIKVVRK